MKLPLAAISARMTALPKWRLQQGKVLSRDFEFPDFKRAFAFMSRVAVKADEINHHPNWSNVYNKVKVELWTHDENGLTERDFELADFMESASHSK